MFNFVFLCPKRWFRFNSRIDRTHFSSIMTLNNWKMIAATRSYIFKWHSCFRQRRVCLSSLVNLSCRENHSCQASESILRLFCTTWWTWNNRETLNLNAKFYFKVTFYFYSLWKSTIWRKANWECMLTCINFCQKVKSLKEVIKKWFFTFARFSLSLLVEKPRSEQALTEILRELYYGIQRNVSIAQKWLSEWKLLIILAQLFKARLG